MKSALVSDRNKWKNSDSSSFETQILEKKLKAE